VKVSLSPESLADLKEIGRWIALDNPGRARSFIFGLRNAALSLDRHPQRFPIVPGSGEPPIRKRVYRGYLIFYRVETDRVKVSRIVHGSRDWAAIMAYA
jgi:toxin ParE1/3/4